MISLDICSLKKKKKSCYYNYFNISGKQTREVTTGLVLVGSCIPSHGKFCRNFREQSIFVPI